MAAFRDGPLPSTTLGLGPVCANASRVTRTGTLLASGEFRLDDVLAGLRPVAVVRWGMVTRAVPGQPGFARLLLREKSKLLRLSLLYDPPIAWTTFETARPAYEWDAANPGPVMVGSEAVAPAAGKLAFSVLFTPGGRLR